MAGGSKYASTKLRTNEPFKRQRLDNIYLHCLWLAVCSLAIQRNLQDSAPQSLLGCVIRRNKNNLSQLFCFKPPLLLFPRAPCELIAATLNWNLLPLLWWKLTVFEGSESIGSNVGILGGGKTQRKLPSNQRKLFSAAA